MKAVSTIVAAIMIVTIALGLTSTAYIWGKPLVEKRQEASVTEQVYDKFLPTNQNSLPKIIEDVANNRGLRSFTINANGAWTLNAGEDSIEFIFSSKTANIASDTQNPISLTSGTQCTGTSPPNSPSPLIGILGQDSSSVVCVSATTQTDIFIIKYKIWFRELDDNPWSPSLGWRYKIDLEQEGSATSTSRTVKITFDDSTQQTIVGKTLITKKIKILLI